MTGTSTENFGWVQELRGRCVVVRDRDGVETLVPNQNLITSTVINWSYSDRKVRLKLPVRISYRDDPELALQLLLPRGRGQRARAAGSAAGVAADAVLPTTAWTWSCASGSPIRKTASTTCARTSTAASVGCSATPASPFRSRSTKCGCCKDPGVP